MSSLKSSGDGLPAFENDSSADSNPYAYPYFHCNGTSPLIYELVVQFARHWNELSDENDVETARVQLNALVLQIQKCCRQQPEQASWRDSCGDTALHRLVQVARFPSFHDTRTVLLFANMLVSVAEVLIDTHNSPDGSATRACNNWKETPLHQFCSHCAFPNTIMVGDGNESVIDNLVENPMYELLQLLSRDGACSLRNCWGSYPLHDACGLPGWEPPVCDNNVVWKRRHNSCAFMQWMQQQHGRMIEFLISQNTKAVGLRVEDGQTPLYRAFQSLKCSTNVIQLLLSHLDNAQLSTCLPILWQHYEQLSPLIQTPDKNHSIVQGSYTITPPLDFHVQEKVENLGILWETTVLVLQKVSCHQDQLVHSTVSTIRRADETTPSCCPLHVIQLAARLYPRQLLEQDEHGNTPLSLAIENTCRAHVVTALLAENPRAASTRTTNGRFPLHLAIDKGVYSYHDALFHIFTAAPAAATTRDPITALFPFALAALNTPNQSESNNEDEQQVSTIYQLLRIDPSVL